MPLGEKALRPSNAIEQPDGTFRRPVVRYRPDGTKYEELLPCCERCWEPVPYYIDAPNGWVSPDSSRKLRQGTAEGKAAVEARQKVVCYDCYKADALDCFGVFDDFPHAVRE
jgi:hypothetical protein